MSHQFVRLGWGLLQYHRFSKKNISREAEIHTTLAHQLQQRGLCMKYSATGAQIISSQNDTSLSLDHAEIDH